MAEKSELSRSTDELTAKIARSRERVHRDVSGLQYEMNFSAKLQRSYLHYTTYWLSGAAAVGMLMALLPLREKKIYTMAQSNKKTKSKLAESGFALGALNIGANLIRPAIAEFVKNRLNRTVHGRRTTGHQ
jgi:type IV secretory pathway component VirB8